MTTKLASHPWITFEFPWKPLGPHVWFLLGEAQARCEQLALVPLQPDVARELSSVYLAKGVLATAAIEGNTLTESDVRAHLEGQLDLPESKQYLEQEVRNIIEAANEIFDSAESGTPDVISTERLFAFNRMVLRDLPQEPDVVPGEIRTHSVVVGPYKGVPAGSCLQALSSMCEFLNNFPIEAMQGENSPPSKIATAILKAITAHLYLVWIHPFGDGNGRTARLLELMILSCAGVAMPPSHLLSDHYNQTRSRYYRELNKASRNGGDITSFIEYGLNGFIDGLKEQAERIRIEQWKTTWTNYVHEQFKDKTTAASIRQRHLMLDISEQIRPTDEIDVFSRSNIKTLSPRLAVAYEGVGPRTIPRDINALEKMGLLWVSDNGYVMPNYVKMLGFSPRRRLGDGEHPIRSNSPTDLDGNGEQ